MNESGRVAENWQAPRKRSRAHNIKVVRSGGRVYHYLRHPDGRLSRLPSGEAATPEALKAYERKRQASIEAPDGYEPMAQKGLFIGTAQHNRGNYFYARDGAMVPLVSKLNTPSMFAEIAGDIISPEDFDVSAGVQCFLANCLSRSLSRDKERGRLSELSLTDLVVLYAKQQGRCAMTGIPFVIPEKMDGDDCRQPWLPSIDRIDNRKGYTVDNVQIVTVMANLAKAEFAEADFLRMCAQAAVNKGLVKIGIA